MNFKEYLKKIQEETTSGDIATVDTKLDLTKKCDCGKDCDCEECLKNKTKS